MKKSLSLTLLVITGFMLFSIASCGGSKQGQYAEEMNEEVDQYATEDYTYEGDEAEDAYDTYDTEIEGKPATMSVFKAFPVYIDGNSPDNHYIPSGYMGDYSDIKIDSKSFDNPYSGTTCIRIVYTNNASQGARWAGVYWQNPANNWGERKGGFDLTGATRLTFWARGENGGERVEEFKVGGITGTYSDSDVAGIGPVLLTTEWKQYEIDLRGKDLSYISGGFAWSTNPDVNPEGAVFYLDDIRYE